MVNIDEPNVLFRYLSYFYFFIISLALLNFLLSFLSSGLYQSLPSLSMVLFFMLLASPFILAGRHFKALDLRRRSAVSGNLSIPLAEVQPMPNEAALPLPITITLVPRRGVSCLIGSAAGLFFLLFFFWQPFITNSGRLDQFEMIVTYIQVLILFCFSIGLALFACISLLRSGQQEITATEEGLTVRRASGRSISPGARHASSPFSPTSYTPASAPSMSYWALPLLLF